MSFPTVWSLPEEPGEVHVNSYLSYLAVEKLVAASTRNKALAALFVLYEHVPERRPADLGMEEEPFDLASAG